MLWLHRNGVIDTPPPQKGATPGACGGSEHAEARVPDPVGRELRRARFEGKVPQVEGTIVANAIEFPRFPMLVCSVSSG